MLLGRDQLTNMLLSVAGVIINTGVIVNKKAALLIKRLVN
jgi:hypothetical protein